RGVRWSATKAFLRPVLSRPNLHVITHTHVERIELERRDGALRAVGVTAVTSAGRRNGTAHADGGSAAAARGAPADGARRTIGARREVILAAGAIGSPQILQLSGVGPGELLRDRGVDVLHDLPGVGENLHDHLQIRM